MRGEYRWFLNEGENRWFLNEGLLQMVPQTGAITDGFSMRGKNRCF